VRRRAIVTLAIQLAILAGLAYWTFTLLRPFFTIIMWSINLISRWC
jgi:hypothetical protein